MAVNQELKSDNGFLMKELSEKNLNEFDNSLNINCETGNPHNFIEGRAEKASEDIVDLLPKDPFGMDISTTNAAISGDFGLKNLGLESSEDEDKKNIDDQLLGELNNVCKSATEINAGVSNMNSDTRFTKPCMEFKRLSYCGHRLSHDDIEDVMGLGFEKYSTASAANELKPILGVDGDNKIESCPSCQQIRQIYDCPADSCRGKPCRGCTFCISCCINCGCCLTNRDYEETFCLDLVCLDCCSQEEQKIMAIPPK